MKVHVGENVHGLGEAVVGHVREVAGAFLAGARVDVAAAPLYGLGYLQRGARRRSLEEHVLYQVGDSGRLNRLVARAGRYEQAERDGLRLARQQRYAQPVRQFSQFDLRRHFWHGLLKVAFIIS